MLFLTFLRNNSRWLAGCFLLTFFSSVGQTFFISLSAGEIRAEYGLSHGGFGTLYMLATLGSALTLPKLGQIVDRYPARTVALIVMPALAAAAVGMALSAHLATLLVSIYCLRLFGQGMMTQNAFTATGRWFAAQRGRAVSVVTLGHNVGEAIFPVAFVALMATIGWRNAWLVAAAVVVVMALPLITALLAVERQPQATDTGPARAAVRDWTRPEVLRDPIFYLLLLGVLAPGFIGTTVFFHQVYLVELRGWSQGVFAAAFVVMASTTVVCALVCGQLIDSLSAIRLLPGFLIPLGLACLVLAGFEQEWSAFLFMALMGASYGFSSTLFGALWPEVYGTRHLGSVRAVMVAILVFATAVGPGLTGFLIDRGVSYPLQILVMGLYCFAASALLLPVSRAIRGRLAREAAGG